MGHEKTLAEDRWPESCDLRKSRPQSRFAANQYETEVTCGHDIDASMGMRSTLKVFAEMFLVRSLKRIVQPFGHLSDDV